MSDVRQPEIPLQVITPTDSRASVRRARRHLERAARELASQVELESWRTLGYRSWAAMVEAEYGPSAFMVPSKTHPGWGAVLESEAEPVEGRPCAECGRGVAGRSDRVYCSSACRQRAYRAKTSALPADNSSTHVAH